MPGDAPSSAGDNDGDDEPKSPALRRTARQALRAMLGLPSGRSPGENEPGGDADDSP